ncbi:MAG: hypothetical protein ACFFD9_05795, partial [Candidatus Thorarchaeota archaeon]
RPFPDQDPPKRNPLPVGSPLEKSAEGRLYAVNIPSEKWIPVNDLKGIEAAHKALEAAGSFD